MKVGVHLLQTDLRGVPEEYHLSPSAHPNGRTEVQPQDFLALVDANRKRSIPLIRKIGKICSEKILKSEVTNWAAKQPQSVSIHSITFTYSYSEAKTEMKTRFLAILMLGLLTAQVGATQIEVTVTTTGPVGLAPAFAAFHDGSYDIFDLGGTATSGLELLAEVGDASDILSEAGAAGVTTSGAFAPGGPFAPNGGTGSHTFTVDPTDNMFSLASMLLPSNDYFIGTDNAIDITSLHNGPIGLSLAFNLSNVYDAGTEEEDFAFAPGGGLVGITTAADPAGGTATANAISLVGGPDPFASFANIEPVGFDTTTIDFTSGPVANITLTVVPEPGTLTLAGAGIAGLVLARRRRRQR